MGILLSNATLLARSVSNARVTTDLVTVGGDPEVNGTYNPNTAEWVETFSLQECIERLEAWPVHHSKPGQRVPYSARTDVGERWLRTHVAEQDRIRTEAEARQASLTIDDLEAIKAGLQTLRKL